MTRWEDIFEATTVPEWLLDFDRDPFAAVDAALWRKYYFGSLNVADPAELLIDWALGIGERLNFVGRLDDALAEWIQRNWGQKPNAKGKKSATVTAIAWIRLAEIVANVETLRKAATVLRQYFDDRQAYLGPLSEGPSRDPLGRYLYAVARHQEDRSLESVWWYYCDLIAGIPWYHGLYGIWGLRNLPPATEQERGRFPRHVAIGLARLAVGLYKRSRDRSLSLSEAKAEFQRIAHLTLWAYPFPERWREYWSAQIACMKEYEEPIDWMRELVPELTRGICQEGRNGEIEPARALARENVKRSAGDIVGLYKRSEVLKAAKRLSEAEAVYRETLARFPQAVFARLGLEEVMIATGKLREPIAIDCML